MKIYVLFGPSQVGKNSFINTIAKQPKLALVGYASGLSVTSHCTSYKITNHLLCSDPVIFIDVPGYDDNKSLTPNTEIVQHIKNSVFEEMKLHVLDWKTATQGLRLMEFCCLNLWIMIRVVWIFLLVMLPFCLVRSLSARMMFDGTRNRIILMVLNGMKYSPWESLNNLDRIENNTIKLKEILEQLEPFAVEGMNLLLEKIGIEADRQHKNQKPEYDFIPAQPVGNSRIIPAVIKQESKYKTQHTYHEITPAAKR